MALVQTAILAPTLSAGNSSDITVTAATPTTVSAYTTDAGGLAMNFQAFVEQKMPSGAYQQYVPELRKPLILSQDFNSVCLKAPGTYRVRKFATPNLTLGFSTDVG